MPTKPKGKTPRQCVVTGCPRRARKAKRTCLKCNEAAKVRVARRRAIDKAYEATIEAKPVSLSELKQVTRTLTDLLSQALDNQQ